MAYSPQEPRQNRVGANMQVNPKFKYLYGIPASKELTTFVAPLSLSTQSVVSDRHLLYACLAEQILRKFPRSPGGTEYAQTVCTRLIFLHPHTRAWEQG